MEQGAGSGGVTCDLNYRRSAQCTATTTTSEDDTTSETETTYTRAPRVELQEPRRTARNRGDKLSRLLKN